MITVTVDSVLTFLNNNNAIVTSVSVSGHIEFLYTVI